MFTFFHAPLAALDPAVVYRIFWLRSRVFIVEQQVGEPDIDGRDLERGTLLAWGERDGELATTLRILREGDTWVIGRVATAPEHRGLGAASQLMDYAVDLLGAEPIELHAQAHLEEWYAGMGFTRVGDVFEEAGIPHVMMRRLP